MNFSETIIGHRFFEHQLPELIEALQQIGMALSRPAGAVKLPITADPNFLQDLFSGEYEAEAYTRTAESTRLDHAVMSAEKTLMKFLPPQALEPFEAYQEAVKEQSGRFADRVYQSGFRTAVQMILAGLSTPNVEMSGGDTSTQ